MAGSDIRSDALADPISDKKPPAFEQDTKNLDALLDSLNGSAERFQTLWFSFLGLTLYLAIAALATTHRDLLLNNPQTLPILNIKVELLPFYVIAPLLYLVFHFYLLMMLVLLARTAAEFDKQLRTTLPGEPERERYRARVENALFLQLLVGMKGERFGSGALFLSFVVFITFVTIMLAPKFLPLGLVALIAIVIGPNALRLGLVALFTIVLTPLATLVLMQMMFLPYHHFRITWWHRGIVVADLVLIVVMTYGCFFPRGCRKAPLVLGALGRKLRWATAMAFCILLAVALGPLTYWLSFQEGRWAGEPKRSFTELAQGIAGDPARLPEVNPDYATTANGVVFGLFPDRLKLRNETIVGEERLERTKKEIASRDGDFVPTIKLDGRDLQAADLSAADLRGVSLNGAVMLDTNLTSARLDGARLSCVPDPDDAVRQIPPSSIQCANLLGASLSRAELQGADLRNAFLPGAYLYGAQLQGANLRQAQLQGGDLIGVQLQGANLLQALLEGADLSSARLQGANLVLAQLQGANLEGAGLQGANLDSAKLQGADLSAAQLQGAKLNRAQLQGAHLARASLTDAELKMAVVWRTDFADADLSTATIWQVRADQVKLNEFDKAEPLTQSDIGDWIAAATQFAPEVFKTLIIKRFARLKLDFQTADQDARDDKGWKGLADSDKARDPTGVEYRRRLATILGDLACGSQGAPYVARGLVGQPPFYGRLVSLGDQLEAVRNRMKAGREKPDACKGVAGFTEDDWRALDALNAD